MSEFAAIISVLVDVVVFIFERIIDVVCFALLVASLALPYRGFEMYLDPSGMRYFREYCIHMFGITLLDCIAIPFFIVGFLSPLRLKPLCLSWGEVTTWANNEEIRFRTIISGFYAIFDVPRFIIGLIALADPFGRQFQVIKTSCKLLGQFFCISDPVDNNAWRPASSSYCNDTLDKLFNELMYNGLYTILDILCLVLYLVFGIWMPTTWTPICCGIYDIINDPIRSAVDYDWENSTENLRWLLVIQIPHAFLDLFCAPFALALSISPLRCVKHWKLIGELRAADPQFSHSNVDKDFYHYNYKIRECTFETGLLCLSDILMIPFLLPLWVSHYRYSPIKKCLDEGNSWGFEEFGIVIQQFCNFLLDLLIVVPFLPIVFLTQIRYNPIKTLFNSARDENQNIKWEYIKFELNGELYYLIISQFGKLLCDIIFFPFTLFVIIFHYRAGSVIDCFKKDDDWNHGVKFHCTVLGELMIILHDFCFMIPLSFMVLVVAPWRFVNLYQTNFKFLTYRPEYEYSDVPVVNGEVTVSSLVSSSVSEERETNAAQIESKIDPWDWRKDVWQQFFAALVDFPFFAFGLVVFATLWRTAELYFEINAIITSTGKGYRYRSKYNWEIRCVMISQFWFLIIDIICLIPFAFIGATLYKLPKLFFDLYVKTLGPPMQTDAIFQVKKLQMHLPDTGGPLLSFSIIKPTHSLLAPLVTGEKNKTVLDFDPRHPIKLQVISSDLWTNVTNAFGSSIASVGRSFFPMSLTTNNQQSNYFSFNEILKDEHVSSFSSAVSSSASNEQKDNYEASHVLAIKLGKYKRSTVMKKLAPLSAQGSSNLFLQLEGVNNQGGTIVLARTNFDMRELNNTLLAVESALPAQIPADAEIQSRFGQIIAQSSDRNNNFVNSFSLVVTLTFVEIIVDLMYMVMLFLTILNPFRFVVLVRNLLESASFLPYRLSQSCFKLMRHSDDHIIQYRNSIAPAIMGQIKKNFQTMWSRDNFYANYSFRPAQGDTDGGLVKDAEKMHLKPYSSMYSKFEKTLGIDGCEKFLTLIMARYEYHDQHMNLWFKRMASNLVVIDSTVNKIDADRAHLVYWILDDEIKLISKKLIDNKTDLEKEITALKEKANAKENRKCCGIFNRSSSSNQFLIKTAFMQVMADIFAVFMLFLVLVTLVRALPLLKDLINNRAYSVTRYATKHIIRRHLIMISRDLLKCLKLFLYVLFIIISVVCLPSYLLDFYKHLGSLDEAFECARYHCNRFWKYFCEVFYLAFACKSYTIVLKSSLYAVLVPAACISESLPKICCCDGSSGKSGRFWRFSLSFLLWVAMAVGAAFVSSTSNDIGQNDGNKTSLDSCKELLSIVSVIGIFVWVSIMTGFTKRNYLSPNALPSTSNEFTWSYILGLLCGPIEFLQLAAVVMFFFWDSSRSGFGTDNFSGYLLRWGDYGGKVVGYHNSVLLATSLCIIWGIIVTIPIVISSDILKKIERSRALKNSPFYQFLVLFITRLFPVWIMATFMRASSCIDSDGSYVMSTAKELLCGGDSFWAAKSSLVLLVFFIITSSILHSDDANLLNYADQQLSEDESVKFSPIYTLIVRFGQVFILAACLGGFWASNLNIVLGIVIALSLIIGALPMTSLLGKNICSLPCVMPVRSAGWFCIAWVVIICLVRFNSSEINSFGAENVVFIGWAVIYVIAIIMAIVLEKRRTSEYNSDFSSSGLKTSLENFVSVCRKMKEESGSYFSNRSSVIVDFEVFAKEIINTTSALEVAKALLQMERIVPPAKFSASFLQLSKREQWVDDVENFVFRTKDHATLSDAPIRLPSANTRPHNNDILFGPERRRSFDDAFRDDSLHSNENVDLEVNNIGNNEYGMIDGPTSEGINPQDTSNRRREYALLAALIQQFCDSLRLESCSTEVTRRTFSNIVRLNRRMANGKILKALPQDCCNVIYSYMILSDEMKKLVLPSSIGVSENVLKLWQKPNEYSSTWNRWSTALLFFKKKMKKISQVKISTSIFEQDLTAAGGSGVGGRKKIAYGRGQGYCSSGHRLSTNETATDPWVCDSCLSNYKINDKVYTCWNCNLEFCLLCYNAARVEYNESMPQKTATQFSSSHVPAAPAAQDELCKKCHDFKGYLQGYCSVCAKEEGIGKPIITIKATSELNSLLL